MYMIQKKRQLIKTNNSFIMSDKIFFFFFVHCGCRDLLLGDYFFFFLINLENLTSIIKF